MKATISTNNLTTTNFINYKRTTQTTIITMIIMAILVIFTNYKVQAQESKTKFNTGIESYMSGNGNGAFYSAYVGLDKGRNSVSIGPSIQNRSLKLNTGKLSYSYILAGYKKVQPKLSMYDRAKANLTTIDSSKFDFEDYLEHDSRLQLRFYSYFEYTHNARITNNTELYREKDYTTTNTNNDAPKMSKGSMRISTAELGIGAELHIRITKKLYWKNTVAVSGYYHLNNPQPSCKAISPVSVTIGTGFNLAGL